MIFYETKLKGAFIIELERQEDARGFFARTWCSQEFKARGLKADLAQGSLSFNKQKGTIRGMHYQRAPWQEIKLVRCTRGAIYDVLVDLRRNSATFKHWVAEELTAENHRMFYIPEGMAHGFQTLGDDTEVYYQISPAYHPEAAAGVRWNDPAFGITWPLHDIIISDRDRQFPDFHS